MRRFSYVELHEFLVAVDNYLTTATKMVVVGGGAITLGYDSEFNTKDIDTWTKISHSLQRAITHAESVTGLAVPISPAGVSEMPNDFEDRLTRILPELRHLIVLVPDPHDLALSKMLRGYSKDFDAIADLNAKQPLDLQTLIQRYLEEVRGYVTGNQRFQDQDFVRLVNDLYGEIEAEAIEQQLKERK